MFHFIFPKLKLKIERWKWNNKYQVYVSTLGNFKNENKQPLRISAKGGYIMVKTPSGPIAAHRLVMITWKSISNPEKMTVDHLNHNTRDNSIYNLEWVTEEENYNRDVADRLEVFDEYSPSYSIQIKKNELNEKELNEKVERAYAWAIAYNIFNAEQLELGKKQLKKKIEKYIKNGKVYSNVDWVNLQYVGTSPKIKQKIKIGNYTHTQVFNSIDEAYDWGMKNAFGTSNIIHTDKTEENIRNKILKSAKNKTCYCNLIWEVATI